MMRVAGSGPRRRRVWPLTGLTGSLRASLCADQAPAASTTRSASTRDPSARTTRSGESSTTSLPLRTAAAVRSGSDVVELSPDRVVLADGSRVEADRVVLAAGAWSAQRLARRLPVRPVKGQTLRLRGPLPATRIIRSDHVYVVPRANGDTVVGATIEDAGFDETPTESATAELLRGAVRAVPAVAELEV